MNPILRYNFPHIKFCVLLNFIKWILSFYTLHTPLGVFLLEWALQWKDVFVKYGIRRVRNEVVSSTLDLVIESRSQSVSIYFQRILSVRSLILTCWWDNLRSISSAWWLDFSTRTQTFSEGQVHHSDFLSIEWLCDGVRLTSLNCCHYRTHCSSPDDMWVWRTTVDWYWQGKTEELGEKPVPLPLCPPQISSGLTRARSRASAVRGQWLTAWAMARAGLPILFVAISLSSGYHAWHWTQGSRVQTLRGLWILRSINIRTTTSFGD
jgi:hypothetical protein